MKKLYLLLILLAFAAIVQAQHIAVKDFYYAEGDLAARTHGTSVEDQNGYLCALIKVKTTERGLWTFDVGMLGVTKTEMQNVAHAAEIWVYVPFGVTWISIQHEKLGELDHYRFPCSIEKGCTYVMQLTTGKVKSYIEEETTEQWLVFEIMPHDAILEVDDKMWPVSAEGTARNMMPFGTHNYRVQAQNYHPEVGKVEVKEDCPVVVVTLKPNYGWIEVPGDNGLSGAAVYIDNALIGKAPCKSEALKSGQHNVRILKEMFEPYASSVTVNDNETTRVAPMLASDFAHLTLEVDADAEIWVNDELKGTRTWTGDLRTGTYRIECKQKGHEPTTTKKTVTNSMNGEVITLQAPIPIYGSLNVECTPDLATLYIDGKEMGKTPKLIGKILVGEHEVRLAKKGYDDHTETVTITQGVRAQVKATLKADGSILMVVEPQQPQTVSYSSQKKNNVFWGINGGLGLYYNAVCSYLEWSDMYNSDNVKKNKEMCYSIGMDFAFPIVKDIDIGGYLSFGLSSSATMLPRVGALVLIGLGNKKAIYIAGGYAYDDWYAGNGVGFRIGYKFNSWYLLGEYNYAKKGTLDRTNEYLFQIGHQLNFSKHQKK